MNNQAKKEEPGFIMLMVIIMAFVLSAIGMVAAQLLINNARFNQYETRSATAFEVAEAGVNYYLWHLEYNPSDYKDGGTTPTTAPYGPYTHNYHDAQGNLLGTYTLWITPPPAGSTISTVESIGQVANFPGTRTIVAQLGQPSFANYALLDNQQFWFGSDETSNGPVMSNVGVHFDGKNNGPVYSASSTYTPSAEFGGDGNVHNGVWGNGGPTSEWQFPVPAINFSQVTANLSSLQTLAKSGGTNLVASGALGYYLNLNSNGTIDYYKVTNENSSGITKTLISTGNRAPTNGVLFVNDNVWVQATNWPGKITIVAATLPENPSTDKNINIVGNLTDNTLNGSDTVGLIAQGNVIVSNYAPSTITIDAALLAEDGNVWFQYPGAIKSTMNFYGAIATGGIWTWNWTNGVSIVAGYQTTNTSFDSNLEFEPPPDYPSTGTYEVVGWREKLYNP
jgi:hypothetical protein